MTDYSDLNLKIHIDADSHDAQAALDKVRSSLDDLTDGIRQASQVAGDGVKIYTSAAERAAQESVSFAKIARAVGDALTDVGEHAITTGDHLQDTAVTLSSLNPLEHLLKAIVDRLEDVAAAADAWNTMQARLKLVTESTEDYEVALAEVQRVANATNADIESTSRLYVTLSNALKSLGNEQANVADLATTINQAMSLSGASAAEASGTIQQLSQALASGVVRGDEFNSIMEQGPRLAQALADSLGVTTGELRGMAEAGQLTAEVMVEALAGQAERIAAEFAQLPDTIGDASTRLSNAVLAMIGEFDDATGSSERMAQAIQFVTDNLDTLGAVAAGAGAAGLAAVMTKAAVAVKSLGDSLTQTVKATLEQVAADRAARTSAAELATQNAQTAAAMHQRALAARATAVADLAAAKAAAANAETQLVAAKGFQRLAATEALVAALNQQVQAETRLAAATQAATSANAAASAAATNAATAQAAAASKVALMSRALSVLAGPAGLLLAAVAGFAAFAATQDESRKSVDDLTESLDRQKAAIDKLGTGGLRQLISEEEAHAKALKESIEQTRSYVEHLRERLSVMDEVGYAGRGRANMERDLRDAEADLELQTRELVGTEAALAAARERLGESTAPLTKGELERLQVSRDLSAGLQTQAQALDELIDREQAEHAIQVQRHELAAELARAFGDEEQALRHVLEARQENAAAAERSIELANAELANAERQLQAAIDQAAASTRVTQAQRDEIAAATELVEEKRLAIEAAEAAAAAAELEATKAQLAIDTYGDQSAKIAELAAERERLRAALEAGTEAQQAGAAAQAQLADAEERARVAAEAYAQAQAQGADNTGELSAAAKAAQGDVLDLKDKIEAGNVAAEKDAELKRDIAKNTAQLTDAANDLVAAKARELTATERATEATQDENDARITHLQNLAKEAEARGDTAEAARLNEEAARAQIDGLKALIKGKEAELTAEQALLEAKVFAAELDGEISEQERQGIENTRESVAAKKTEIAALKEQKRHLEELQSANQDAADSTKDASEGTEDLGESMQQTGGIAAWMAAVINSTMDDLRQYSAAAADAVQAILDSVDSWNNKIATIRQLDTSSLFDTSATAEAQREMAALGAAAESARSEINALDKAQRGAFNYLGPFWGGIQAIKEVELAAIEAERRMLGMEIAAAELGDALGDLQRQLDDGGISTSEFVDAAERLEFQFQRLDDEDLEGLRDAIRAAKEEMADFTESAQAGLRDLQAEWAELNGQQLEALLLEQEAQRLEIEMALAEAKRDGNTEAIRALEDQLEVLEQIQAVERERAAEAEAQAAIDAAEAEAEEAARRAALSDADRAHEDSIATLEARLLEAVRAQDQALEDALAAQIAAERQRHETTMANLEAESAARASTGTTSTAGTTSDATGSTGTASASRAIDVRVSVNGQSSRTITVADEASADALESILSSLESAAAVAI
ncbi:tape measure protein [Marichromatium gracile]|uniref:tape measure protein n=1 Tax=Marichromatium gracile TaxID=1048 RepID=UPI001F159D2D|nr:tape measure protein [Marichromatium gracile]MCF1184036.1 tape measure protein [Marichromatium gracile]